MYESFFGLQERPFELAPNPKFLLLTSRHAEALSNLEYGMTGRKGMTLLLGEAGTGKTTVIRTALEKWQAAGHLVAYVNNPTLTRDEFVECLAETFLLQAEARTSKARMLSSLTELVMRRHAQGQITGLLIDEAQSLSDELLEEIRLLANVETASEKVFPVVLAGQPELADRLNAQGLRQLKQRIALRCVLSALDVRETGAYIAGRIRLAGGVGGQLFTREAVVAIHKHSRGIPRVINVICDNVLLSAFAANLRPATQQMVEEVAADFDLDAELRSERGSASPAVRRLDRLTAQDRGEAAAIDASSIRRPDLQVGRDAPPVDRPDLQVGHAASPAGRPDLQVGRDAAAQRLSVFESVNPEPLAPQPSRGREGALVEESVPKRRFFLFG